MILGGLFRKKTTQKGQVFDIPALPVDPNNLPPSVELLVHAVAADRVDILEPILAGFRQAGSNLSKLWIGPQNLLHCAAQNGAIRATEMLLKHGFNVNQPTRGTEVTPLIYAVRNKNHKIAKLLLTNGADVQAAMSAVDPRYPSMTALHAAALVGDADVVSLLLARGADRERRDGHGLTAVQLAEKSGHNHLQGVLLAASSTSLPAAIPPPAPPVAEGLQWIVGIEFVGRGVKGQGLNLTIVAPTQEEAHKKACLAVKDMLDQKLELFEESLGIKISDFKVVDLRRA